MCKKGGVGSHRLQSSTPTSCCRVFLTCEKPRPSPEVQKASTSRIGCLSTWRPRGLSKSVISRVIIRVTPFRVLITLLITYLLSQSGPLSTLDPALLNPTRRLRSSSFLWSMFTIP